MGENRLKVHIAYWIIILIFGVLIFFYEKKLQEYNELIYYTPDKTLLMQLDSLKNVSSQLSYEIDSLKKIKPSVKYVEKNYTRNNMDSIVSRFIIRGLR